jgi:hypothetical protein
MKAKETTLAVLMIAATPILEAARRLDGVNHQKE